MLYVNFKVVRIIRRGLADIMYPIKLIHILDVS
jgi:hypothetical protein